MRFKFSTKLAAAIGLVVANILAVHFLAPPRPVFFETPEELIFLVERNGLHCHSASDPSKGLWSQFYVAHHPGVFQQLPLSKRSCGQAPEWRGLVWVTSINQNGWGLDIDSIGGRKRIWGKVVVAGDEELMDAIEQLYRKS
jgi:hypothetical protein